MDLKKALKEFNEESSVKRPKEIVDIMTKSAEQLVKDKIGENALKVGDKIPNFTLNNANGEAMNIYDCLAKGPIIINFYRGGWCPYCNLELKAYKDILPKIKELGGNLIAISPELPDNSLSLIEKHELGFEILSDLNNVVAKKFGLVFKLDENIIEVYKKFGIDVEKAQGNDKYELPIPATYVIDKSGRIAMAYVNIDYTERLEPSETLKALSDIESK